MPVADSLRVHYRLIRICLPIGELGVLAVVPLLDDQAQRRVLLANSISSPS
jgi:hypothetical protein